MAHKCAYSSDRRRPGAFTLIEILVVVAIIALLISILLPSLTRAREQARAVACGANLSQVVRAENIYQAQNSEWIPGSPLTTGYYWAKYYTSTPGYAPSTTTPGFNRLSLSLYDYVTPLKAVMYGPKSIPQGDSALGWAQIQKSLWAKMFEGVFHCPSNPERYAAYPTPSGWPIIQASSYLTMQYLITGGPSFYSKTPAGITAPSNYIATSASWEISAPAGYVPRHSMLKRESMKAYLVEGFRYYDNASGELDYDQRPTGLYSSFVASNPPAIGGTFAREWGKSRKYSYRHRGNRAIEVAFFDGHVEQLFVDFRGKDELGIGYGGNAVDPRWYYPTGSTINDPSVLHKTLGKGLTLP